MYDKSKIKYIKINKSKILTNVIYMQLYLQCYSAVGTREADPAGNTARQHDGTVGAEMGTSSTQYVTSI